MFGMKNLPCEFRTEQAYRVLELLRHHNIRCQMPSDEMYFVNAFRLPHPDLRWRICVRRLDYQRATEILAAEGLINGATRSDRADEADADPTPASPAAASRRIRPDRGRSGCRCSACAAPAARPVNIP